MILGGIVVVGLVLHWLARIYILREPWEDLAEKHGLTFVPGAVAIDQGIVQPRRLRGRFPRAGWRREIELWDTTSASMGLAVDLEHPAWSKVTVRSRSVPPVRTKTRSAGPATLGTHVESVDEGFGQLFEVYCRQEENSAVGEHLKTPGVIQGLQLLTAAVSDFEISDGKIWLMMPEVGKSKEALEFQLVEVFRFLSRIDAFDEFDGFKAEAAGDCEAEAGEKQDGVVESVEGAAWAFQERENW